MPSRASVLRAWRDDLTRSPGGLLSRPRRSPDPAQEFERSPKQFGLRQDFVVGCPKVWVGTGLCSVTNCFGLRSKARFETSGVRFCHRISFDYERRRTSFEATFRNFRGSSGHSGVSFCHRTSFDDEQLRTSFEATFRNVKNSLL